LSAPPFALVLDRPADFFYKPSRPTGFQPRSAVRPDLIQGI